MAPVPVLGPVSRLIGYVLFVAWCTLVAVALSATGVLRLGRLAGRLTSREPTVSP